MGFIDNLKSQFASQFIEIIEWLDTTSETMVYRFPVYNQEIKMGAQLVVRENQAALFVNEGKRPISSVPVVISSRRKTFPSLPISAAGNTDSSHRSRRKSTSLTPGCFPI
jgi:hypothetical protein